MDADTDGSVLGALFLLGLIFFVYFLPSVIACGRKMSNSAPIIVVNTFLGWTLIGWVCALAWSVSASKTDIK